ncbi:carboxylesterase/lipase family protein [Streptomyces sp. NPDC001568]|uniref:carboxylesterase/lipase family protein n=1 Tax=Streptomyces sp. NPDC001568 TaxID=3364588 RepID=UPI0036B1B72F
MPLPGTARPTGTLRSRLPTVLLAAALLLVSAAAGPSAALSRDAERPVLDTSEGPVRGRSHGSYDTFEGIPYAAPPTGPLRWRLPVRAPLRAGVLDAGTPGSACVQLPPLGPAVATGSEDCLFLNVTTPAGPGRDRPVMVWFHPGGFRDGSGAAYRPEPLVVRGDVVVVTVNYRLGVFGLFGHPELGGAPNFALADQQAALRWVRANAGVFGGDPDRVTVFGVSAGGLSVCAHLVSPASAGLFGRAIAQSGSCSTTMPPYALLPTPAAYEPFVPERRTVAAGTRAARELGCGDRPSPEALDCLRGLDATRLATAELMERFSVLSYGNGSLPMAPRRALESGRFHRVPVVQGTSRDEMRLFLSQVLPSHPIPDERVYRERLVTSFGAAAEAVGEAYPAHRYPTAALAWAGLLSDASFTCPALRDSRALARHVPTYGYRFSDRDAPVFVPLPQSPEFPFGATHGFELPYLFRVVDLAPPQQALSERMTEYWTRFARTGSPNGPDAPSWPPLATTPSPAPAPVLSLAAGPDGIRSVDARTEHHCSLWDSLPPFGEIGTTDGPDGTGGTG